MGNKITKELFKEPASPNNRAMLVKYIGHIVSRASKLSDDELTGVKGELLASQLTMAMVFNEDPNFEGHWIAKDTEPELSKIAELAYHLDGQPDDRMSWQELFQISRNLQP